MKISTKLMTTFFMFAIIVSLFSYYIIIEIRSIDHIDEEIDAASHISQDALNFNVENFHTQLEIWEYAIDPNQKRLDAFLAHQNTLHQLLDDWQTSVNEEDYVHEMSGLYDGGKLDMDKIISDLELVEQDWIFLLQEIENLRIMIDTGTSYAELEQQRSAVLLALNNNEELFDELHFNTEVDQFVFNQHELVTSYEELRKSKISQFMDNMYLLSVVVVLSSLLLGYLISKSITRRVNSLKESSIQLAKGEFSQVTTSGNDELDDLAKSFNIMAEDILQSKITINENLSILEKQKITLDTTLDELKKSTQLREEFASMVTHELKTPLTPIKGYCEMLKDASFGPLTQDQIGYVEKIDSNASTLERLIGDVLDVQRLEMGKMKFNKENFDVSEFLYKLKQDFLPVMKDATIEFVVADIQNVSITSDEFRLREVLNNLIRNSIDFVPLKNARITIGAKQENGKIIFHVKDNGTGIPKDKHKNIFKKFYQVDTSATRKHGGAGLGLVICKGIVNGLGGKMWFESELGKGTIFYFEIPMRNN